MNDIYIAECVSAGAGVIVGIFLTLAVQAWRGSRLPKVEQDSIQSVLSKL